MSIKHLLAGALVMSLTGCACSDGPTYTAQADHYDGSKEIAQADAPVRSNQKVVAAIAHIRPVKENDIRGTVVFTKVANGVKIVANFEGLSPGSHGFHIHEHGSCADAAEAAGAHFNPSDQPHGAPDSMNRHAGDLGNLVADENGRAHYERIDKVVQLEGKHSIIGRALLIHADPDDYTSQPSGAAGSRIACGVIEAVSIQ